MASQITSNNKLSITPHNKRSQITIFIILGLIIIVLVILFFLLRSSPETKVFDENQPHAYIETCIKESLEKSINVLSIHGGDINPKGSVLYEDIEVSYLCYNNNYFKPCTNQRPLLIEHIENEITDYITPKVETCFQELRANFEKRYDVDLETNMELTTKLQPKNVYVEIKRELKTTRDGKTQSFDDFKVHINHPIYDLAEISMNIVNQESQFCDFDVLGYMILYPEYDVTKDLSGDSNLIYTVTERSTDQKFRFAIRGCLMPPSF
jgi:hypothetical protein